MTSETNLFEPTHCESLVLGFTGTQHGMATEQLTRVADLLRELRPARVHHGDCIGADTQFHALVRQVLPECRIVIHPPRVEAKRAFCDGDETKAPRAYLTRNRAIVRESQVLLAAPSEREEQLRSGTWSTVRFARQQNRTVHLVLPDHQ